MVILEIFYIHRDRDYQIRGKCTKLLNYVENWRKVRIVVLTYN